MLSQKQKQIIDDIVNDASKFCYIKGFTGTGKTVILLNILNKLLIDNPKLSVCFLTYTDPLIELAKTATFYDSLSGKVPFLSNRLFVTRPNPTYDCILVDEIQDMTIEDLIKLRTCARRLICAGDFNQQMYLHRVTEAELLKVLAPHIYELTDIYRLTRYMCKLSLSVAPKTRIVKGLRAHYNPDSAIEVRKAPNEEVESRWVWREATAQAAPGRPSCVLLPSFKLINDFSIRIAQTLGLPTPPIPVKYRGRCDYTEFNRFWIDNGINYRYVDNACPDIRESEREALVFIMTYHSAKGLTFKSVFLPFLSQDTIIIKNNVELESRLLFTASTRSGEKLYISYSGDQLHYLLKDIPPDTYRAADIPSSL
ncbi:MAG: AAA family ATPase [Deltaproteobacteria bacterium]|nr:AAA family ATPase [Deltaproteobacteria bacterium]